MAQLIRFDSLTPMPWKNGGGTTYELAVAPKGATIADFDFRISLATISQDGPFSLFPNVDRTLALVEGEGVTLDIDSQREVRIDHDNPMIAFPGEVAIHARVNDGSTMDFNVMTQRSRCRHEFEICELGLPRTFIPKGDLTLIFLARGERLCVQVDDGEQHQLSQFDAILFEPGRQYTMHGTGTRTFIVDIHTQPCTAS
jgi:uncharacterized protein